MIGFRGTGRRVPVEVVGAGRWLSAAPSSLSSSWLLSQRRRTCRRSLYAAGPSSDAADGVVASIQRGPRDTVLFIDNILPLSFRWLPYIPLLNPRRSSEPLKRTDIQNLSSTSPLNLVWRAIPPRLQPSITEIVPRYRDGAAFVRLSLHEGEEEAKGKEKEKERERRPANDHEIAQEVQTHLKSDPIQPWFRGFRSSRAGLVRGRPWIEDLHRFPSSRLKVEFVRATTTTTTPEKTTTAAELTQETLYALARPYGKMGDIVAQPADSKALPRYALLDFAALRYAVMAKNCLHGLVVPEEGLGGGSTLLRLTYEPKIKGHWFRDWIFSHPRLVVPVVAAVLAAITVFIFDPIRTMFIKAHIAPPLSFDETNRAWQWVRRQATRANDIFWFRGQHRSGSFAPGLRSVWEDRENDVRRIQNWLLEAGDTFIVVQGPKGSGKKEFVVDGVLRDSAAKRKLLVVDCKAIQEAQGDSAVIAAAAAEVGYRPVFSWMNSLSSIIDATTQNAIGAKAGLSQTLDTQLGNILQNTANALKQIALEGRKKSRGEKNGSDDKDARMTDDEFLEAHAECRPVVVIDNFLHKSGEGNQMVYDKLADWAAALTSSNIARVVFLTTDATYSKTLSRALPGQVFHQVSLSDCTPDVAKRSVLNHLRTDDDAREFKAHEQEYMAELDECIGTLGGRLTDIETLARMISRGERPTDAVCQIIDESAAEILKMFLVSVDSGAPGATTSSTGSSGGWSVEQAWYLITQLGSTDDGTVRYSDVLNADIFKSSGGEAAIHALEQTELISVTTLNGRPSLIKPGRPVYSAGFRQLISDDVLRARLDMRLLSNLIAVENAGIAKNEQELRLLEEIQRRPWEIRQRVKWLLDKVMTSQDKVEKYEQEIARLRKVLRQRD